MEKSYTAKGETNTKEFLTLAKRKDQTELV